MDQEEGPSISLMMPATLEGSVQQCDPIQQYMAILQMDGDRQLGLDNIFEMEAW